MQIRCKLLCYLCKVVGWSSFTARHEGSGQVCEFSIYFDRIHNYMLRCLVGEAKKNIKLLTSYRAGFLPRAYYNNFKFKITTALRGVSSIGMRMKRNYSLNCETSSTLLLHHALYHIVNAAGAGSGAIYRLLLDRSRMYN